jgi:hypothetical protein
MTNEDLQMNARNVLKNDPRTRHLIWAQIRKSVSVREIEAHDAAYILDHSDALSRRALLDTAPLIPSDLVQGPAQPQAIAPQTHCSTT